MKRMWRAVARVSRYPLSDLVGAILLFAIMYGLLLVGEGLS